MNRVRGSGGVFVQHGKDKSNGSDNTNGLEQSNGGHDSILSNDFKLPIVTQASDLVLGLDT